MINNVAIYCLMQHAELLDFMADYGRMTVMEGQFTVEQWLVVIQTYSEVTENF